MFRSVCRLGIVLAGLSLFGCGSEEDTKSQAVETDCKAPEPPAEARRQAGTAEGLTILPGGRVLAPTGKQAELGGFPVDIRMHPTLPIAYIANTGYRKRAVQVVSTADGSILQEIDRTEAFYGLALSPDGKRLLASGGFSGLLETYDVGDDGRLTAADQVDIGGGYPAGVVLSSDGSKIWVGKFLDSQLVQLDAQTLEVATTIDLPTRAYAIAELPQRNELYVTGFGGSAIMVVDVNTATVAATLEVGGNPVSLAVAPDEKTVFASVSDGDVLISIDTGKRELSGSVAVSEPGLMDPGGNPLPGSSPTGLTLDPQSGKLYVARAADNAVSVFDSGTLAALGAFPTGWYPTAVALTPSGSGILVANGKGGNIGPLPTYDEGDESGKERMSGTLSLVDLSALDLAASTAQVEANVRRPSEVYPFQCDKVFPVPTEPGGETPIEHIVLIVRENKTYDTLLGEYEGGDGDASKALFGQPVTPNISALARQFANHDNFYNDGETSIQGHLWLTSSFVNDYIERTWFEDYRNHPGFSSDGALDRGQPDFGTFFTHLIKHQKSFIDFGEVVGTLGKYGDETVISHADLTFPGAFYNLDVADEEKANHVVERLIGEEDFPQFTYLLLPRDHTKGTGAGEPTPESMIADNDYATGIVVDAISKSKFWDSTAIFIVQDDTQMGADHVDYHRSILVIASPWAKRGYTSKVHTSFPSLFRTFELILGIPPMNRYDALATPLYDAFTMEKDSSPYELQARKVPDAVNPQGLPGADWSQTMDFSGPDRNAYLGDVIAWYRKGKLEADSELAREIARGAKPHRGELEDADEDDARERDIYEKSLRNALEYAKARGIKLDRPPQLPVAKLAAEDDDD
ncbi:MAG: bifunctional YncE family protein/alkaline phosphatase family protein [Polyangiaceae bacterium]